MVQMSHSRKFAKSLFKGVVVRFFFAFIATAILFSFITLATVSSQTRKMEALLVTLRSALIFECLDLIDVPEGNYFWVAVPLRLEGVSESPVCPILLKKEELTWGD
jgi:kynurenine formamidase